MESEKAYYTKVMSQLIYKMIQPEDISFNEIQFEKIRTEKRLPIDELESFGVFDPNRYKKD